MASSKRLQTNRLLHLTCNLYLVLLSHSVMIDDTTLINHVLNGDRAAFKILVQRYEKLVLHMVYRVITHSEDCEDVCQEVFLKVYQKLPSFRFESKLSTWIATVAYRTALTHTQRQKSSVLSTIDEEVTQKAAFSDPNTLDKQAVYQYIHLQIAQLPVQYRVVLTLYHLEEKSHAEIQAITGMPEGTVKNYLFRARKLLKDKLLTHFSSEELQ